MKNKLIKTLILLLFVSGFTLAQNNDMQLSIESVKKEKLKAAKTVGDIIPNYPTTEYSKSIDYVSVNILGTSNGKHVSAKSTSDVLTPEQQQILSMADIDSNIGIEIQFTYKDPKNNDLGGNSKVKQMSNLVKVSN